MEDNTRSQNNTQFLTPAGVKYLLEAIKKKVALARHTHKFEGDDSLPIASDTVVGGMKVGKGLESSNGTVSVKIDTTKGLLNDGSLSVNLGNGLKITSNKIVTNNGNGIETSKDGKNTVKAGVGITVGAGGVSVNPGNGVTIENGKVTLKLSSDFKYDGDGYVSLSQKSGGTTVISGTLDKNGEFDLEAEERIVSTNTWSEALDDMCTELRNEYNEIIKKEEYESFDEDKKRDYDSELLSRKLKYIIEVGETNGYIRTNTITIRLTGYDIRRLFNNGICMMDDRVLSFEFNEYDNIPEKPIICPTILLSKGVTNGEVLSNLFDIYSGSYNHYDTNEINSGLQCIIRGALSEFEYFNKDTQAADEYSCYLLLYLLSNMNVDRYGHFNTSTDSDIDFVMSSIEYIIFDKMISHSLLVSGIDSGDPKNSIVIVKLLRGILAMLSHNVSTKIVVKKGLIDNDNEFRAMVENELFAIRMGDETYRYLNTMTINLL